MPPQCPSLRRQARTPDALGDQRRQHRIKTLTTGLCGSQTIAGVRKEPAIHQALEALAIDRLREEDFYRRDHQLILKRRSSDLHVLFYTPLSH